MKPIKTIEELGHAIRVIDRLKKYERVIHRLQECDCNYGALTKRQETRYNNTIKKAVELTESLGLKLYVQEDPRGCALYLIEDGMGRYDYNNGIACC